MKYTAGETKTETEGVKQNETREERKKKQEKTKAWQFLRQTFSRSTESSI